jgi:hypothetical protein
MVGLFLVIWPVPALAALVPVCFGRGAGLEGARWLSGRLVFTLAVAACVALLCGFSWAGSDTGSLRDAAVLGVVVVALFAIPAVAFYSLGYAVRRGWLVGALWLAGTLPLTAYTVYAGLAFFDLVVCGDGCSFAVD